MSELREELTTAEELERQDLNAAIREVLATASGKRVVAWFLAHCMLDGEPYCGEVVHDTHHRLGRQYVGRAVVAHLKAIDPRIWPMLQLEAAEDEAMKRMAAQRRDDQEDEDDAP